MAVIQPYLPRHITIAQGAPFIAYIPVYDENGDTLDLSGMTFTAKIADWGGTVVATLTVTATTHPDTGEQVAKLYLADTSTLTVGIYRWDMIGTLSAVNYPIYYGECSVLDIISV